MTDAGVNRLYIDIGQRKVTGLYVKFALPLLRMGL